MGTTSERVTEYGYTDGDLTTITRYPDGGTPVVTEMQYDDDGNLQWQRDPSGKETLYTYSDGKIHTVHTDRGVWRYAYDADDRLISVTDPSGDVREREYDDDGNVREVRLNGEIVATYTYQDGNLTQRTDANGQPYTFSYNADGQLTRQEDPEGAFVEYEYDEGRLWKSRDGNGNEIVREYAVVEDSSGSGSCPTCFPGSSTPIERLHKIFYPTFTKEFVYLDGRVSQEIYHLTAVESYAVSFTYDDFGRLESTTGPDNETTSYGYDVLGRRTSVTDSSGTTRFEYDNWDNLKALTDAQNQRTEFEYYADGTLWKERRPMGEETEYQYDRFGRLWKILDAKNQLTEYGYDDEWRLETISYTDGKTVTLSYDADGNLSGYTDGDTSGTYTYDDMGRKLTETVDYGPFSKSFSYTYYGNGLKYTFTAPDNTVYTYNYGTNNELQSITIPGRGDIAIPAYTWNRPATINYPGGTQRSLTYDALMRLETLTVTDSGGNPLLNYGYPEYDEVGNILIKQTEHGNYTYDYDTSSRLITADNPVLDDESYTYDDVGNRLTASGVTGTWDYNQNNELLGYADVTYDYDNNGNMTEISIAGAVAWTYEYDAANRLVHAEDGTGTISADYYYDPFGRRLWKEVNGTRTYFFYSEEGLIAEYDASGNEIRSYGYKPDSTWTTDPLWLKENGSYYWYQNDHLGTPQKLTAQDGTVVWSAQYTAFGEAQVEVETIANNLRFPGQYYDAETGLHYNYFRYYDSGIGRYLQVDPIGFNGGTINLYGYARHNSINAIDPYGLFERDEIGERIFYSCNCGWVDTVHLEDARDRLWRSIIWPKIEAYEETKGVINIIDNLYLGQPCKFTYLTGEVQLKYSGQKTREEKIRLALNIAFSFEMMFELHQSGISGGVISGFAIEDLPSDFLGFMEAAGEIHDKDGKVCDWSTLCKPLDKDISLKIYDYGLLFNLFSGPTLPLTNGSHEPKLWDNFEFRKFWETQGECHPCVGKDTDIPDVFKTWIPNKHLSSTEDYDWISFEEHFGYAEFDSNFWPCAYDRWGR